MSIGNWFYTPPVLGEFCPLLQFSASAVLNFCAIRALKFYTMLGLNCKEDSRLSGNINGEYQKLMGHLGEIQGAPDKFARLKCGFRYFSAGAQRVPGLSTPSNTPRHTLLFGDTLSGTSWGTSGPKGGRRLL